MRSGHAFARAGLGDEALEEGDERLLHAVLLAGVALEDRHVAADADYDPAVYRAVYERLLTRRHVEALMLDQRLPTATVSAYDFRIPIVDLLPTDEVDDSRQVKCLGPTTTTVRGRWAGERRTASAGALRARSDRERCVRVRPERRRGEKEF